jgi:hypothetical protein
MHGWRQFQIFYLEVLPFVCAPAIHSAKSERNCRAPLTIIISASLYEQLSKTSWTHRPYSYILLQTIPSEKSVLLLFLSYSITNGENSFVLRYIRYSIDRLQRERQFQPSYLEDGDFRAETCNVPPVLLCFTAVGIPITSSY